MRLLCLFLLTAAGSAVSALPEFTRDEEADAWLRGQSATYARMAREVDARGGCLFMAEPAFHKSGEVRYVQGQRFIALAPDLAGPERLSILIFEMTNAWQGPAHLEVDDRARRGEILHPVEFGILHELVEYDGLRYHRAVLAELEPAAGTIPASMLAWINPRLGSLREYELPLAYVYIATQAKSGHTARYHEWFWRQKGVPPS